MFQVLIKNQRNFHRTITRDKKYIKLIWTPARNKSSENEKADATEKLARTLKLEEHIDICN